MDCPEYTVLERHKGQVVDDDWLFSSLLRELRSAWTWRRYYPSSMSSCEDDTTGFSLF
jgi:hypothetical protein